MKNKGFTLIELLAVIILLALIAIISTPIIVNIIGTSKEKAYENQKKIIEDSAKRWVADNPDVVEDEGRKINIGSGVNAIRVYIEELKTEGYLSSNNQIENPKTKEPMEGCVIISEDTSYNQYKYEYHESDSCS